MRLISFQATGGAPEVGAIAPDGRIAPISRAGLPTGMIELIARWDELKAKAQDAAGRMETLIEADQVTWLAPAPRPGKIMAIGLNYADHVAESGQAMPERQIWFSKAASAAHGPYADVQLPKASTRTDYEAELVAVIGSGGRHISREAAPAAVFGWCAGNDVSVRDWQMRTSQWVIGKSFDTHAPFGPWIVTADEVPDPHALAIRAFVNGEKRQESNTRNLVFNVWAQLEELSQAMTLEPGDLIFTGTPGGVGMAMQPPQFLKDGDVVKIEIEGVGAIENTFRPEG
ncbi:MAG TPA: fumarylacetoacetate hydrolase family protein [Caulobacteraceae bacterium]|jgi:2-keto-4-pentenoate hydratase/2-oxohepta-3-ene-1,7-dioic acid hydratase in catechol pathway